MWASLEGIGYLSSCHVLLIPMFPFLTCYIDLIVKLRSRSRLGEGQVRVRKVRDRSFDLSYTVNLVFTTLHTNFFLGFSGLYKTSQMDLGWVGMTQVGLGLQGKLQGGL